MKEDQKGTKSSGERGIARCGARRTGRGKLCLDEVSRNLRAARSIWGPLPHIVLKSLRELTKRHHLSVTGGDLAMLGGQVYITHGGLLRISERNRCSGIVTCLQRDISNPTTARWIFKATVYKTTGSKGFVGYGDADPSNTSPLVRGAEMRVAETRAVSRALRKAYGIGICSVEELAVSIEDSKPAPDPHRWASAKPNHSNNGQPRLRDQLCVLIRRHNLDPTLVKAYAADFCGTATLSGASRELVESFISHLSTTAKENRDSLICKLNSFAQSSGNQP
jgi:hypothetical protein